MLLPIRYDPAAAIPMKWGAVYMAVFMGFWGLGMPAASFTDTQHFVLDITVNVAL